MARNKIGELVFITATDSISQAVIRGRCPGKDCLAGNDIARTAIRGSGPGGRYGQLDRGIGADAACLTLPGASGDPDRVGGVKTVGADGPGLRGIVQGGASLATRGTARPSAYAIYAVCEPQFPYHKI